MLALWSDRSAGHVDGGAEGAGLKRARNTQRTDSGTGGHRQRLRERFIAGVAATRTDEAVLELVLSYAIPRKDVQPLAKRLLVQFGDLNGVLRADFKKLSQSDGVGAQSAVLLKLLDFIRARSAFATVREGSESEQARLFPEAERPIRPRRTPGPRPSSGMFGKAILKEAIDMLPRLPETESLEEIARFLRSNLHFNSEQTRQRNASYIIRRMFPGERADGALLRFAQAFKGRQELRDVAFYRFCTAEPLMLRAAEGVLLPAIGSGRLNRGRLREFLRDRGASDKSLDDYTNAVVEALTAGGIVKADRVKLTFAYREVSLPSFAFVVHSEFPEPGMYDIAKLEESSAIRALLWRPDRILPSLYELRNLGLIAKVSEIDSVRQFTTRWTLEEIVERLVSLQAPAATPSSRETAGLRA
jgi:DNA repair protein RadC